MGEDKDGEAPELTLEESNLRHEVVPRLIAMRRDTRIDVEDENSVRWPHDEVRGVKKSAA